MKSSFISLAAVASLVGYANATMMFKDPWSESKPWKSGENAMLKWTSDAADADKLCDIQMLNGDKMNSNIVATVTNPKNPVKCGANEFEIAPLNDFKTGKYWVRIGQAATNTWTYSGVFDFQGKGTVSELKLADGAEYPSAEKTKEGMMSSSKAGEKKAEKTPNTMPTAASSSVMATQSMVKGSSSMVASSAGAKGSNSASASRPLSISIASSSPSSSPGGSMPNVKNEAKNEEKKKSASGAGSDVFQLSLGHHAAVMGLASLAAYVLAV